MSDKFQYKAGLHNVGSYQVSGIPYVTGALSVPTSSGTPVEIVFPSLTQRIHIHNNDDSNGVKVGFSANGVKGSNYWLVEPHAASGKNNDYIELRVKTDRIFLISNGAALTSKVFVAAELTGITGYELAASLSGTAGIG